MADDESKVTGEDEAKSEPDAGTPTPDTHKAEPDPDEGATDKHGEPAINRGRYERDIRAKDDEIAALKKQIADMGEKARNNADALKKVEALEAQLADEKVNNSLTAAGCVDLKAAKARLDDFDGDVSKLKEACPYLFKIKTGSTGARPSGAASTSEERRKRAQEAIKGKFPARR